MLGTATTAAARLERRVNSSAKNPAAVVQRVARLPFQTDDDGASPISRLHFDHATVDECIPLLAAEHYLGPCSGDRHSFTGWRNNELVACQVYRWPMGRMLPSDGTWLELSRWCLTPDAGKNAGSRMMGWVARWLRRNDGGVHTLVSYSDPEHGHTGGLYRASGWRYAPTHIGRRFDLDGVGFPSGNGSWDGVNRASSKHRWIYDLRRVA
jgi:hypothetical protein